MDVSGGSKLSSKINGSGGKLKKGLIVILVVISLLPINLVLAAQVPRDFLTEVSKGNIPGHRQIHKGAQNPIVGTTWECIWENGSVVAFPPTATRLNISSTDADDAAGGTGAWNVTIIGLDANWVEINETIQLNGQINVTTVNSYIRTNFFYIREAGSSLTNEGNIHAGTGVVAAGVSPVVYNLIGVSGGIGHGRALSSFYSVPINHTAFIMNIYASSNEDKKFDFGVHVRVYGEGWMFRDIIHVYRTDVTYTYDIPMRIEEQSDISLCAKIGVGTAAVSGGYCLLLVDNDVLGDAILDWSDGTTSGTTSKDPTIIFAIFLGVVLIALLALVIRSKR